MKKLFILLGLFSLSNPIFGQKIISYKDNENTIFYYPERDLVLLNSKKTNGIKLSLTVNDSLNPEFISVELISIKNFYETDWITLHFDKDISIKIESLPKFSPTDWGYYRLSKADLHILETHTLQKVVLENSYNVIFYEWKLSKPNTVYYQNLLNNLKTKNN